MDSIDKKTLAIKKLYSKYGSSLGDKHYDTDGKEIVINQSNLNSKIAEVDLDELRAVRNQKLTESDWMTFADSPTISDAWKTYRQKLRDITKSATSLDDVTWPTKPSG